MNPCKQHKMNLALLAAGALDNAESRRLQQHLVECPGCRQYRQELLEICNEHSWAGENLAPLDASEEFHFRLEHRIRSREPAPQRTPTSFDWRFALNWKIAISTAAAVALVLAVLQFRPKTEVAESIPPISKPKAIRPAGVESKPSFLAYRLAANRSLEALDALLASEATKSSASSGTATAFTREQVGLTD
jgi:Putative zinc-finger